MGGGRRESIAHDIKGQADLRSMSCTPHTPLPTSQKRGPTRSPVQQVVGFESLGDGRCWFAPSSSTAPRPHAPTPLLPLDEPWEESSRHLEGETFWAALRAFVLLLVVGTRGRRIVLRINLDLRGGPGGRANEQDPSIQISGGNGMPADWLMKCCLLLLQTCKRPAGGRGPGRLVIPFHISARARSFSCLGITSVRQQYRGRAVVQMDY
jgi:hypothetical protein